MTRRRAVGARVGDAAELLPLSPRTDIMAMPDMARRYTVRDILAFPEDGKRYELIGGELIVSPSPKPRHQVVVGELYALLREYLKPLGLAHCLFMGPADISWDDDNLVQPDLLVVAPDQVSNDWRTYRRLLLAVEVISPSSLRTDRLAKRRLYQANQVETYWIVDHETGLVEVWHPDDARPEIVSDVLTWRALPDGEEHRIDLPRLFDILPG
jgi:Uma2 family endonuclease